MSKYLLTVLVFGICIILFGQHPNLSWDTPYEAVYRQQACEGCDKVGVLLITKQKSLYYHNRTIRARDSSAFRQVNDNSFELIERDTEGICVFTDFREGKMMSRTHNPLSDEAYILYEPIPDIAWKITDEQIQLGKFVCTKATAQFRGRLWIVWFTSDVPVRAGPWKLQGLPGLIVQASTEADRYYFKLEKLIYPTANNTSITAPKNGKRVNGWDYFVKLVKRDAENWVRYIKSMGPGYNAEVDLDSGLEKLEF
jgi:GLPGLI family protein